MNISRRIKTAAEMVTPCGTVADIGCDHCLSLIYLMKNRICDKGIGVDIKKGPLERAKKNIRSNGLHDDIELRLGFGLTPIIEEEADAIIIAGMGGHMINDIMNNGISVAKSARELILQPHRDVCAVRKNLHSSGFAIVEEVMISERKKYYVTLKAKFGSETYNKDAEYMYGKLLIERKDLVLKQFLVLTHNKNTQIIDALSLKTDGAARKLADLEYQNNMIEEVLSCM